MRRIGELIVIICVACAISAGQDLKSPDHAVAGAALKLETSGSGDATLYLVGPASAIKRSVKLGEAVELKPEEVSASGIYTAALKGGGANVTRTFYVAPAAPSKLVFLARPSRVAVGQKDALSGVIFLFDANKNLSFDASDVHFQLTVNDAAAAARSVAAHNGIAWTRFDSARREGPAQFVASVSSRWWSTAMTGSAEAGTSR